MLKKTGDDLNPKAVVRGALASLSLCYLAAIAAISLLDLLDLTAQYTTILRALAGFSGLVVCVIILNRWAVWRSKAEPAASHHPSVAYPEQVSQVPVTYQLLYSIPTILFIYIIWSALRSGEPIWRLDHFDSDAALVAFMVVAVPEIVSRLPGISGK